MPKKKKSITNAVILIADIEDSSMFAEHPPHAVYNKMVREFHRIASKAFEKYTEDHNIPEESLFLRAYGDEILIIFRFKKSATQAVRHAISTAVMLDVKWIESRFNNERIKDGKQHYRIRVGIGKGQLTFEEDVWNQGITPEGYAIVQTKRIESNAKGELHQPHILVKDDLRKEVEAIEGVELGETYTIGEDRTKGIMAVNVFSIDGYAELYDKYQRQVRTRNQAVNWINKGFIAAIGGNLEEAERSFYKVTELKPDLAEAW